MAHRINGGCFFDFDIGEVLFALKIMPFRKTKKSLWNLILLIVAEINVACSGV
jgi:hypothetical protein